MPVEPELYNIYAPILKKMGILSELLIVNFGLEVPKVFIDDGGFLRVKDYIVWFRTHHFPVKRSKSLEELVDWPFIDQYLETSFPEYNDFINKLATLLKSIKAFEIGNQIYSLTQHNLNINNERKQLIYIPPLDTILGIFLIEVGKISKITEEGKKTARDIIIPVMLSANNQYKKVKIGKKEELASTESA